MFNAKKSEIKRELDEYDVLDIAGSSPRRGNQRYLLSTLEVGVVVLGCVIFVGALVTALCVTCVRRNKRYETPNFHLNRPISDNYVVFILKSHFKTKPKK